MLTCVYVSIYSNQKWHTTAHSSRRIEIELHATISPLSLHATLYFPSITSNTISAYQIDAIHAGLGDRQSSIGRCALGIHIGRSNRLQLRWGIINLSNMSLLCTPKNTLYCDIPLCVKIPKCVLSSLVPLLRHDTTRLSFDQIVLSKPTGRARRITVEHLSTRTDGLHGKFHRLVITRFVVYMIPDA